MEDYEERTLTKEEVIEFLEKILDSAEDSVPNNNTKSSWGTLSRFFDCYIPESNVISLYKWLLKHTWNNLPEDHTALDESNQLLLFETEKPKKLFSLYVSRCGCCGDMLLENDRGEGLSEYAFLMNICWSDEYCLRGEDILLCEGCYESESMHPAAYDIEIYEDECEEPVSIGYVGNYLSHIEEVYDEVTELMYVDETSETLTINLDTAVNVNEMYDIDFSELKERAELDPLPEKITLLVINNSNMIVSKQDLATFDKWYHDMQKCHNCSLYLEPEELCLIGGTCITLPGYNPNKQTVEDYITGKKYQLE